MIDDEPQVGLDPDREAAASPRPPSLTWAEVDARVETTSLEFVVGYLAVVRAGFVAVPLDPDLEPAELSAALRHGEVAVALAAEGVPDLDVAAPLPRGATGQVRKGRLRATLDAEVGA